MSTNEDVCCGPAQRISTMVIALVACLPGQSQVLDEDTALLRAWLGRSAEPGQHDAFAAYRDALIAREPALAEAPWLLAIEPAMVDFHRQAPRAIEDEAVTRLVAVVGDRWSRGTTWALPWLLAVERVRPADLRVQLAVFAGVRDAGLSDVHPTDGHAQILDQALAPAVADESAAEQQRVLLAWLSDISGMELRREPEWVRSSLADAADAVGAGDGRAFSARLRQLRLRHFEQRFRAAVSPRGRFRDLVAILRELRAIDPDDLVYGLLEVLVGRSEGRGGLRPGPALPPKILAWWRDTSDEERERFVDHLEQLGVTGVAKALGLTLDPAILLAAEVPFGLFPDPVVLDNKATRLGKKVAEQQRELDRYSAELQVLQQEYQQSLAGKTGNALRNAKNNKSPRLDQLEGWVPKRREQLLELQSELQVLEGALRLIPK